MDNIGIIFSCFLLTAYGGFEGKFAAFIPCYNFKCYHQKYAFSCSLYTYFLIQRVKE